MDEHYGVGLIYSLQWLNNKRSLTRFHLNKWSLQKHTEELSLKIYSGKIGCDMIAISKSRIIKDKLGN